MWANGGIVGVIFMKFIIVFIVFFFSLFTVPVVFAQFDEVISLDATDSAVIAPQKKVEYELAYPGILPDHPLYFLKASRDRLVSFLINDTAKRAEFDLLTADKRIYAGIFLINKGKDELAVSTISKGNNYFEEAIAQATILRKSSKTSHSITNKLYTASLKYTEVLKAIKPDVDRKYVMQFEREEKRIKKHTKDLEKYIEKP